MGPSLVRGDLGNDFQMQYLMICFFTPLCLSSSLLLSTFLSPFLSPTPPPPLQLQILAGSPVCRNTDRIRLATGVVSYLPGTITTSGETYKYLVSHSLLPHD